MLDFRELLTDRMQEIFCELRQTNGDYAVKFQKSSDVLGIVDKILMAKGDQIITENDKQSFNEFMDLSMELQGIEQAQYYFFGYLDCVSLLKALKVIS